MKKGLENSEMPESLDNVGPTPTMVGGLLQTVGGTSAPIVFAIRHASPRVVVLVVPRIRRQRQWR